MNEFLATGYVIALSDDAAGEGRRDVQLTPDGVFSTTHGDFVLDGEGWKEIEHRFRKRNRDLVFDWEHQSEGGEFARADGRAPAAGWIRALRYEPGRGLIAEVDWVDEEAREWIRGNKYRFVSPVLRIRPGGRIVEVKSAALTNTPSILAPMERLAAKETEQKESKTMAGEQPMETGGGPDQLNFTIGRIFESLGIKGKEGGQTVPEALEMIMQKLDGQGGEKKDGEETTAEAKDIRKKLNLKPDASPELVLLTVSKLQESTAGTDKRVEQLETELKALKEIEQGRKVEEVLQRAFKDNKINPNNAEHVAWCRAAGKRNIDELEAYLKVQPAYVSPGETKAPAHPSGTREKVIAEARSAYDGSDFLKRLTDRDAFVDEELRKNSLSTLSKEEREKLAV